MASTEWGGWQCQGVRSGTGRVDRSGLGRPLSELRLSSRETWEPVRGMRATGWPDLLYKRSTLITGWRRESRLGGRKLRDHSIRFACHLWEKKEIKDHSQTPGLEGWDYYCLRRGGQRWKEQTGKVSWGSGCGQSGIWLWICLFNIQVEHDWSGQLDTGIWIQGIG